MAERNPDRNPDDELIADQNDDEIAGVADDDDELDDDEEMDDEDVAEEAEE